MLEGSVSINGRELETMLSFRSPTADIENDLLWPLHHRDLAALKLQKVYKSFRTRRQLADCAVLAEQRWWRALDFAELKRSSISFFDIEKHETAVSRWTRARKRAAKVGKGLSKDKKARKLALQHWLEAIDPRHRYGHNLQFYYVQWLHCDSNQPFFYWLDIGEGREFSSERCSRSRLQQQCIKYLGPEEREAYEIVIENGMLFYKHSGFPVDSRGDAKMIFVLSTSKTLYIGHKNKGTFQHSSFLAGGATLSAGRLVVEDGILKTFSIPKAVWPHSGHYLPTEENFQEFVTFLRENDVDLTDVKKNPIEDDEIVKIKQELHLRRKSSEAVLPPNLEIKSSSSTLTEGQTEETNEDSTADSNSDLPVSRLSQRVGTKIPRLEIPKRDNLFNIFGSILSVHFPNSEFCTPRLDAETDCGYETAEESFIEEEDFMVPKSNLFVEDEDKEEENPIPKEKIMKRITSHKGMKSYQLAYQLSTKWTTGAGPRIGCMRDYPPELQFYILEQQNLSPRTRTTAPSPQIPPLSRFSPHIASVPILPGLPTS
ncbi:hypothetical protein TSUD_393790 [Trifolium subterraneum]|uniref:IQ domain-containing protein IQM6 n=1 Tax=Trifolium subterraneum TaxID=3900 RepID=A0A2Z6MQ56_TRISU|nr:hypothetical protein TSUD_393790 [Trifolium subterraneum]